MKYVVFLLAWLFAFPALAVTAYTCTATGNWSSTTTWNPATGYPGSSGGTADTFSISSGTVTVDSFFTLGKGTVSSTGRIVPSAACGLTLTTAGTGVYLSGNGGAVVSTSGNMTISDTGQCTLLYNDGAGLVVDISGGTFSCLAPSGTLAESKNGKCLHVSGGSLYCSGNVVMDNAAANVSTMQIAGGTASFIGVPLLSGTSVTISSAIAPVTLTTGVLNWTGSPNMPSGFQGVFGIVGGLFNMTGLQCSNSGSIVIMGWGGGSLTQGGGVVTNTGTAGFASLNVSASGFNPGNAIQLASSDVWTGVAYTSGSTIGTGSLLVAQSDVWLGSPIHGLITGTLTPTASNLLSTYTLHGLTGTYNVSNLAISGSDVLAGITWGPGLVYTGTITPSTALTAAASDVWTGVVVSSGTGSVTGTLSIAPSDVWVGSPIHGSTTGSMTLANSDVWTGVTIHSSTNTGTITTDATKMLSTLTVHGTTGSYVATSLTAGNVHNGVSFGVGLTGTDVGASFNTSPGTANVAFEVTWTYLNTSQTGSLTTSGSSDTNPGVANVLSTAGTYSFGGTVYTPSSGGWQAPTVSSGTLGQTQAVKWGVKFGTPASAPPLTGVWAGRKEP